MSVIRGGFFTIAKASLCIFCAIIYSFCSMINLLCGVLRGENKQATEINSRMKNMWFPEIHIYSILLLSMASTEKLKILKRPVVDEIATVQSEKLYGTSVNFLTNYNPLKKLLAGGCKVGLGIILSSSPFVDNFGKNKVIINTNFPNKLPSLLLRSSPSSSLIGHDLKIVPDESPIGMLMKKTPLDPSSILCIGNNNNNNDVVSDQIRDHVLMEKISCVFGAHSMSTNYDDGSKKLIAICRKHRNAGFLSLEEIEKTDNYSRKITNYLPNLKVITHMYNSCILEFPQIQSSDNNGTNINNQYTIIYSPCRCRRWSSSSDNNQSNFLKNCETCGKLLEGHDIYIYRGESSFCSPECRYWKVNSERDLEKLK